MKCTVIWIDSGTHHGARICKVNDSLEWVIGFTTAPHVFESERGAIRVCVGMKKAGKKMPAKIGLRAADIREVELRDDVGNEPPPRNRSLAVITRDADGQVIKVEYPKDDDPDTAPPFGPDHPVTISPDMVES